MSSTYVKIALKDNFTDIQVMRIIRQIKETGIVEDVSIERCNKPNKPNYRPAADYQSPWA